MATPRVKIILNPSDLAELLEIPEGVEIVSVATVVDPPSVIVYVASTAEFNQMYIDNYGQYYPDLTSMSIPKEYFKDKLPE